MTSLKEGKVMIREWMVGNNSWSSNFNDTRLLTCGAVESKGLCSSRLPVVWEMLKEEEIMTTTTT